MGYLIWLVIGVTLLVAEILTGAFVFLFFGIAGCLVALLTAVYFLPFWAEGVIFGVLSLLGVALLRKRMIRRQQKNLMKNDEQQTFVLEKTLAPNQEDMIQYQGSLFRAQNVSSETLPQGSRVRVVRTEGTRLLIEKEN